MGSYDYGEYSGQSSIGALERPRRSAAWAAEGNSQVVAQPGLMGSGTSDPVPTWNGDPMTLDLFTDAIRDWSQSTLVPSAKQAHALLPKLPPGPRQRLRTFLQTGDGQERLKASSWREAVGAVDHFEWYRDGGYQADLAHWNKKKV